ncbi:hypothetical protein JCM3774_005885 [Rhodotorula dairenensis]
MAVPALHDHSHAPALAALVRLVEPFLPISLPLYSSLLTPGVPLAVYATFELGAVPRDDPWLLIADLGNQLRFFCPVEAEPHPTPERLKHAQQVVGTGLELYLRDHSRGRDRISIGAIPDIWRTTVRDTFGTEPFSASEIHYRTLHDLPPVVDDGMIETLPGGETVVTTVGRPEDVAEILATSEVPHPPSYLETRLPYTTVIRASPSPSSTPTRTPARLGTPQSPALDGSSRPASSCSASVSPPRDRILAHCTTHRDGSIGTLHVSPSARRCGFGARVFLARARDMHRIRDGSGSRSEYVFAYVHRENESSNALMKSCAMDKSAYEVWWARVKLPLPRADDGEAA